MGAVFNECSVGSVGSVGEATPCWEAVSRKHTVASLQLKQDLINGGSDCVYFKIRVFNICPHVYISKKNLKNASTAFWRETKCLFWAATILHK